MIAAAIAGCIFGIAALPAKAGPGPLDKAATAVKLLQAGNYREAATAAREAIEQDSGESILHNLAATILLITGDIRGAEAECAAALAGMPDDGLAHFQLALCALSKKDAAKAMDELKLAGENGDRAHCMLAERYTESVFGATGAGAGMALPESLAAGAHALTGIALLQNGENKKGFDELRAALDALPGDRFSEPPGLVMMFDRSRPLRFTAAPLPAGNGLGAKFTPKDKPFSGVVTLSCSEPGADAGFVIFKIDGGVSMINRPPFKLVWDTAKVWNGVHNLEIASYSKDGQVLTQAKRQVRTANSRAPQRDTANAEASEQIRSALWQALTLRPSRAATSYAAAVAAQALGDTALSGRLMDQAAAADPSYRDAKARSTGQELANPALWRGTTEYKVVALTFDDGPKPGVTEQLLAILTRERVPATFFVIGKHATAHPELVKKIADCGMQVENHSYTHANLAILPAGGVEQELLRTSVAVETATGKRPHYFRPPGGNVNGDVTRIAASLGMTPCMWTLDGEALENGSPDRLIEYVVQKASPGAIILLHNGRMTTIEGLPKIIEGLRKRGFGFVTIDQIAYKPATSMRAAHRSKTG